MWLWLQLILGATEFFLGRHLGLVGWLLGRRILDDRSPRFLCDTGDDDGCLCIIDDFLLKRLIN
jgi:hypothetical protein